MIFKEIIKLSEEEKRKLIDRGSAIDMTLVEEIVDSVRKRGDSALKEYTLLFDGVSLEGLRVTEKEFNRGLSSADRSVVEEIERSHENLLKIHKKQLQDDWWFEDSGRRLGQITRPVETVGCYVPGGRAFYPSTVLMAAVPARVAGVKKIICATPPREDGSINEYTLAACKIAGIADVYKMGGAQAISAMAYGTETVPRVDMIVGPGNVYVTAAKKAVYGDVGVDMLAGPSEILIIADSSADPELVVADILAQAEHDPDASCVLVTTDEALSMAVVGGLKKADSETLKAVGKTAVLIAETLGEAVGFSNEYAPEHLEIMVQDEEAVLEEIVNAGSIFLGPYSPVAAGDYASGPNHILPTGGCARFQSGLNVWHFLKNISVQRLSKKGLNGIKDTVSTLAEAEGLKFHSESVKKRF